MRKVEYRCNHCMIVESKWLLNNDRSSDYITCRKCGLASKKIGTEEVSRPNYVTLNDFEQTKGKVSEFLY
jgi:DNA-directed RNA polymerase subunit RPC12/RpoP